MLEILVNLLAVPNFALKVGIMVMSAMFLGAALFENAKDLRKIFLVVGVFVIYQMWIHDTILDVTTMAIISNHVEESLANLIISIFLTSLYFFGLALGMFIVHSAKTPYVAQRYFAEKRLEELRKEAKDKEEEKAKKEETK